MFDDLFAFDIHEACIDYIWIMLMMRQINTFKCVHVVLLLYMKENVPKKILQALSLLNWQKYIDAKPYTNSHLLNKSRLFWFILNKYGKSQHWAAVVALMLMNSEH